MVTSKASTASLRLTRLHTDGSSDSSSEDSPWLDSGAEQFPHL